MALDYLIYCSKALIPDGHPEHARILNASVARNRIDDITGFLHREGDFFLQYLEGPGDAVTASIGRIGLDGRHCDLTVLARGAIEARNLPDWQMGFVDRTQLSLSAMLETDVDRLTLNSLSTLDLVVFLAANAEALRDRYVAA